MRIGSDHEGLDGLYYLDMMKTSPASLVSSSISTKQWHYRLGHASAEKLCHLLLAISTIPDNCEACQFGKQTRYRFPPKHNRKTSGASHEATGAEKSQMNLSEVLSEIPSWLKSEENIKLDASPIESKEGAKSGKDDILGEINMEASISTDDVTRVGGFGAMDDIGSLLPVAIDATDFEHSLLDARDFEGPKEEVSRPGLGWTELSGALHEASEAEKSQMKVHDVHTEFPSWLKNEEDVKLDTCQIESKEGVRTSNEDISGEINMEAAISIDDVTRAGGFGAMDDIGSFLPVAMDATDFEHSLLDARGFEGPQEEISRPGLGWTEPVLPNISLLSQE